MKIENQFYQVKMHRSKIALFKKHTWEMKIMQGEKEKN